jgi:hypothetical protein
MIELWKDIPGFEERYQVSSLGSVRSFARYKDGRLLKPGKASHGYYTVSFGRNNSKTVHSLVALAFIGPCPKGMEILHIDGTRTNNALSNLRYGTRTDNILDAIKHGSWNMPSRIAGGIKGRESRWGVK